jgi:hypothetical protein
MSKMWTEAETKKTKHFLVDIFFCNRKKLFNFMLQLDLALSITTSLVRKWFCHRNLCRAEAIEIVGATLHRRSRLKKGLSFFS